MSFAVQITGTAMRSSSRWMNTRELVEGSSSDVLRLTNRSSASSNSSSVFRGMTSRCASRRPASRSWRQGSLAALVGFGDRAQTCADPRRQGCRERGLAGAWRPVEQNVDADLLPIKRRAQNGGGDFRLAAEMREGVPGQRGGRHRRRATGRTESAAGENVPPESATVSRSSTFQPPVALKLQQAARQQLRVRP